MKKLLFLLSVASLINAMDESRDGKMEQSPEAPSVKTMADYMSDRNFVKDAKYLMGKGIEYGQKAKENLEYAADCGCLTPSINHYLERHPQAHVSDFVTSCFGTTDADPRAVTFCAGFTTAQLHDLLPTWASITGALGAVGGAKLFERKFEQVKAQKKKTE